LYGTRNLPIEFVATMNAIILIILSRDIFFKILNNKKEIVKEEE